VKFQIKENLETTLLHIADQGWTKACKHLFANFKAAGLGIDTIDE